MTAADAGAGRRLAVLATLRTDDRRRWAATVGFAVLGVALASVHWMGLVLGGAVVGIVQRGLARAVVAGLAFGVVVLVAFVVLAPQLEAGELLALTPAVYVTVGATLGLSLLGSLTRGVV